MVKILLIRHAENDWVNKNRLAGWIEGVKLNERGQQQATALGKRLAQVPIAALYSSPLVRCQQTAAQISTAQKPSPLKVQALDGIGEVRYGKWEGKKIKKLAKKRSWFGVQFFPSRFQFPGGESMYGVQARAVTAIEGLAKRHADEMVAVVSHADVIKLILAHYLGTHIDLFQRIIVSTASVSIVALSEQGVRVVCVNDTGRWAED